MLIRIATLLLCGVPLPGIGLPFPKTKVADEVHLVEGTRGIGDAFPYLGFRTGEERPERQLLPDNAGDILSRPVEANGKKQDAVRSDDQALALVRLFVAGVPVTDERKANELIATARQLKKELRHLGVKVTEERPGTWMPVVERTEKGSEVSLVAFEMDRNLQLVQIHATVSPEGRVRMTRKPIFSGPMTRWQSALIADQDADAQLARLEAMRQEADLARRRYARTLQPPRTVDVAWTIARLRLNANQIDDLWPGEKPVVGSGLKLVAVALEGGTSLIYDATDPDKAGLTYSQAKTTKEGRGVGDVVRWLAGGPTR